MSISSPLVAVRCAYPEKDLATPSAVSSSSAISSSTAPVTTMMATNSVKERVCQISERQTKYVDFKTLSGQNPEGDE